MSAFKVKICKVNGLVVHAWLKQRGAVAFAKEMVEKYGHFFEAVQPKPLKSWLVRDLNDEYWDAMGKLPKNWRP